MAKRFHLSSYRTDDPEVAKVLFPEVIKQTNEWFNILNFSKEQKDQTQFFSGRTNRTKDEKGEFIVFSLIPLDDAHPAFPAIWDGILNLLHGEDIQLELKQTGM